MNVDDLFYKIGVLTVENDALRRVIAQRDEEIKGLTTERDELLATSPAGTSEQEDERPVVGRKAEGK